jgi:hypothetical protein
MRTIAQIMKRLELDEEGLRRLLDHGQLDDKTLDPQVLEQARAAFLAAARRKPPPTAH